MPKTASKNSFTGAIFPKNPIYFLILCGFASGVVAYLIDYLLIDVPSSYAPYITAGNVVTFIVSVIVGYLFYKRMWWVFPMAVFIGSSMIQGFLLGGELIVLIVMVQVIQFLIPSFVATVIGSRLGYYKNANYK